MDKATLPRSRWFDPSRGFAIALGIVGALAVTWIVTMAYCDSAKREAAGRAQKENERKATEAVASDDGAPE
jgi:hypothetical protein